MDLEDQLRGDAAGASSARLNERMLTDDPNAVVFGSKREAPGGDPYGELKTRVQRAVIAKLGPRLFGAAHASSDLRKQVTEAVTAEIEKEETPLAKTDMERLILELTADILGYGPLEPYLADDDVTEIMVNGYNRIYVERFGVIESTKAAFVDDEHLLRIVDKIVSQIGRRVDESSPMVDARLPDGSRVNAIIPPLSLLGPTLTIRKFSRDPYTMSDLIGFGSLSERAASFLQVLRAGQAEHPHLRRYRHRQDDDAQRALGLDPRGGAHRDDRGRSRAAAAAGALGAPRVPASRTWRARARSGSASSSAMRFACAPTGSWSARFAVPRRWTCSRR